MTAPFDRPPFGKDPDKEGGIDWEIDKARKRVAFLDVVLTTNRQELAAAEADLAQLEEARRNARPDASGIG